MSGLAPHYLSMSYVHIVTQTRPNLNDFQANKAGKTDYTYQALHIYYSNLYPFQLKTCHKLARILPQDKEVLTWLAHKASKEVPTGTRKKAGRPQGGFCVAKVLSRIVVKDRKIMAGF